MIQCWLRCRLFLHGLLTLSKYLYPVYLCVSMERLRIFWALISLCCASVQEDEANVLVLASEQAVSLNQSSPAETSFSQESCVVSSSSQNIAYNIFVQFNLFQL